MAMEYRFLGASGFRVPVLGLGTGTFGGKGPLFSAWGSTDVDEATRLVDVCLDAGANLFDTADVYSDGASEFILGAALKGRRHDALVSTKVSIRSGQGPNDVGASRHHLLRTVERSLERLGTDYIDLLQLHHFDAMTPVESVMSTLDDLVRSGKVRTIGRSADRQGHPPGGAELAAAAPHRVNGADRRAQRRAAARQPGSARLESVSATARRARCGQRGDAALSLLPVLERATRRAKSGAGDGTTTEDSIVIGADAYRQQACVTDETRDGRRGYAPETGRHQSDPMKPSATRLREERRQRSEAVLEKHLADLFRRLPTLAGFTLREDLEVTDVAVHSWPGYVAGEELYKDLMVALTDLAEERPEAVELLRGRTFARALH